MFTNVALTDDGGVWWEGLEGEPEHLIDWTGEVDSASNSTAAHPNSRYCTPMSQCPTLAPEWDDPQGVPISAILFGGRRKTTVPLVTQARDWQHGVFIGATLGSEQTAAAEGAVGWFAVTRWPCCRSSATTPVITSSIGSTWARTRTSRGCRRSSSSTGSVAAATAGSQWPGFGENSPVLKWIVERVEGSASGESTAIGIVPGAGDIDLDGLDVDAADVAGGTQGRRRGMARRTAADRGMVRVRRGETAHQRRDEFEALKQRLG